MARNFYNFINFSARPIGIYCVTRYPQWVFAVIRKRHGCLQSIRSGFGDGQWEEETRGHWDGKSLCATGSPTTRANRTLRLANSNLCSPHPRDIIYNEVDNAGTSGHLSFFSVLHMQQHLLLSIPSPISFLGFGYLPHNSEVCTCFSNHYHKTPGEQDNFPFLHLNKKDSYRFLMNPDPRYGIHYSDGYILAFEFSVYQF